MTATTVNDPWSALADPTRRAVLRAVAERPASVTAIASRFPVSRPAVSQHLKVLERADLVTARPRGRERIYRANPSALAAFRAELDGFWRSSLATFKEIVESEEGR